MDLSPQRLLKDLLGFALPTMPWPTKVPRKTKPSNAPKSFRKKKRLPIFRKKVQVRIQTSEAPARIGIASGSGTQKQKEVKPKPKVHACNKCEKSFSKVSLLNRHMKLHQGIKPYQCNVCNI